MRYIVQHSYTAYRDGKLFGPWEPDTEVELDEPDAEWVNRDSEGTLKPVDDKAKASTKKPPAKPAGKPDES